MADPDDLRRAMLDWADRLLEAGGLGGINIDDLLRDLRDGLEGASDRREWPDNDRPREI
jgi:hypothetical protein